MCDPNKTPEDYMLTTLQIYEMFWQTIVSPYSQGTITYGLQNEAKGAGFCSAQGIEG